MRVASPLLHLDVMLHAAAPRCLMSAKKRLAVLFGAVALMTMAGSRSTEAQVIVQYPYPSPYRYGIEADSAVRLEVTPRDAEVFVDGYYAGIVDDFDGVFQRLRAAPGAHDITVYRDGYRTITEHVYLMPNATLRIKRTMDRIGPGEVSERPQVAAQQTPYDQGPPPSTPRPRGPVNRRMPPPNYPPPPNSGQGEAPPPEPQGAPGARSGQGTLSMRVQPGDADVLIDGTPWRPPQGSDPLVVDLPEGHHTVQVRKAGYIAFLTDVQIRRGQSTPLDVSLRTQP
jgi:hypothetical protein